MDGSLAQLLPTPPPSLPISWYWLLNQLQEHGVFFENLDLIPVNCDAFY
jgi:hypothetical protein